MRKLYRGLGILLIIGLIMSVAGFLMGMNLSTLGSVFNDNASYGEMLTYTFDDTIDTLDVSLDRRHVTYVATNETSVRVTYYAKEDDTWTFDHEASKLTVKQKEPFRLLSAFNFKFVAKDRLTVTLYIPTDWIENLTLATGTGDVSLWLDDIQSYGDVSVTSGTGDIKIRHIEASTLDVMIGTGNLTLNDVVVQGDLIAHTGTGNLTLSSFEAEDLNLSSGTGNISVSYLMGDTITVDLGTGNFNGSELTLQNAMTVNTSGNMTLVHVIATTITLESGVGNISMTVTDLEDYRFDLKTGTGSVYVDGVNQSRIYVGGTGSIDVTAESGTGQIRIVVG